MIAVGLCQCGCGQPTNIAKQNDARIGRIKGQPARFLPGHQRREFDRVTDHAAGYRLVPAPEHPRATNGRILEHIAVVERVLGHRLPAKAVIHHVDDDRSNNEHHNLAVLQTQREHMGVHRRRRVLRAGGNPWTEAICSGCQQPKPLSDFYVGAKRRSSDCRDCARTRALEYQARRRTRA